MTLREAYQMLGLGPEADSHTIETAYWRHAHALAERRDADPDAADELERLSEAYHTVMHYRVHGPPIPRPVATPSRPRQLALAGVALALAVGGLVAGMGFRDAIRDSAERGIESTQQGLDDTITWLQSLEGEPTPTAVPPEGVSGVE